MEDLIKTFIEEYSGAIDEFEKGRFRNATILFSKSLFALCDILIFLKLKKLPKNHTERFRLLEEYFPESYPNIDEVFSHYTNTYNKPAEKTAAEKVKNAINKVTRDYEVPKQIKAIVR